MKDSVNSTEFEILMQHAGVGVRAEDEAAFREAYRWVQQVRTRLHRPDDQETAPAHRFAVSDR